VSRLAELVAEYQQEEDNPWEIFRGHLLDASQTRSRSTFEAWNLYWKAEAGVSGEPILAVKWNTASGTIYVTRGLLCYVWEPYDVGGNVIETRRVTRWKRELVGEIDVASCTVDGLREELARLLFVAVVGQSRLPLTSVESPLPGFSLGQLAYFTRSHAGEAVPLRDIFDLVRQVLVPGQDRLEQVKSLEFVLRSARAEEIPDLGRYFAERWTGLGNDAASLLGLLREVFVETALSPYTRFVDNSLAFVQALVNQQTCTPAQQMDFLGALLRQTGRHLSAYDLITFHHNGANYPDALLLDTVLNSSLNLVERYPDLWLSGRAEDDARKRRNRRGFRQAWLLRRFYEGHLVPDAPTSPGENTRVLPAPHVPVSDEQIYMPHRRRKRLFDGDPLPRHLGANGERVLRQSIEDLSRPEELRELGMALFLDRPLGVAKEPLEPDRTLLLSYEAYSRQLAEKRLERLAQDSVLDVSAAHVEKLRDSLRELVCVGVPVPMTLNKQRPVVSLQDAFKVADDFQILSTTRTTVRDFLEHYDLSRLKDYSDISFLENGRRSIVLGSTNERGEPVLLVYDDQARKRLELRICAEDGYFTLDGADYPRGGLQALRVWEEASPREFDLRHSQLTIQPRRRRGAATSPARHEDGGQKK
jgi:hypothetical protein